MGPARVISALFSAGLNYYVWRRLVRDYEARIDVSEGMIFIAMGANLLRRNAHP